MIRLATLFCLIASTACSTAELSPEGSQVQVVQYESMMNRCRNLGLVIAKVGGGVKGDFTSNSQLKIDAINELRNKAYKLGATHVTPSIVQLGGEGGIRNSARVTGTAYRCK